VRSLYHPEVGVADGAGRQVSEVRVTRRPGQRTTNDWRVGCTFRVWGVKPDLLGVCVSVTPWGNDQVRWIRLRFEDGTEKSFAPSHLLVSSRG
jgi:hypothetical protein